MRGSRHLLSIASSAAFVASAIVVPARAQEPPATPPVVGPEIELADEHSYVDAGDGQFDAAVAWGDGRGLVAFTDLRSRGNSGAPHTHEDIFASVVGHRGNPIGPPIQIGSLPEPEAGARVAWNGSVFLVVWIAGDGNSGELRAARVTQDGEVLDDPPLTLSTGRGARVPDVASNGTDFLVTWYGTSPGSEGALDVHGTRVSSAGGVLDPEPIAIGAAGSIKKPSRPPVEWTGNAYAVVWQEGLGDGHQILKARRVSASGSTDPSAVTVVDGPGRAIDPDLAWNGESLLAAWSRLDAENPRGRIEAARLADDLSVRRHRVVAEQFRRRQSHVAVAPHGSSFVVAWSRLFHPGAAIMTVVVSARARLERAPVEAVSRWGSDPPGVDIAVAGARHLMAWSGLTRDWEEPSQREFDARAGRFDADSGKRVSQHVVSRMTTAHGSPTVVAGEDVFLVAWFDTNGYRLLATRVTPEGVVLDDPPIVIAENVFEHSLSWDGETFVVGWRSYPGGWRVYKDVNLVRVTEEGAVLRPATRFGNHVRRVEIATGSGRTIAVWQDLDHDRFARVFDEQLQPVTKRLTLSDGPWTWQVGSDTTWTGERFVHAWMSHPLTSQDADSVLEVRAVTDAGQVSEASAGDDPRRPFWPAFSRGGDERLLLWQEDDGPPWQGVLSASIHAAPIDENGDVSGPAHVVEDSDPNRYYGAHAAFTGSEFLSVWIQWTGEAFEMHGKRLTSDGAPVGGTAFQVGGDGQGLFSSDTRMLAAIPGRSALAVYQRGAQESPHFGTQRAFARVIAPNDPQGET